MGKSKHAFWTKISVLTLWIAFIGGFGWWSFTVPTGVVEESENSFGSPFEVDDITVFKDYRQYPGVVFYTITDQGRIIERNGVTIGHGHECRPNDENIRACLQGAKAGAIIDEMQNLAKKNHWWNRRCDISWRQLQELVALTSETATGGVAVLF